MLAGPVHVHHAPALLQQTADCRFKVAECHYIRKTGHMATVCCSRAKQPGPRDPTRYYNIEINGKLRLRFAKKKKKKKNKQTWQIIFMTN